MAQRNRGSDLGHSYGSQFVVGPVVSRFAGSDLGHSFAGIGVFNGAPLMVVGALLGQANYSTTQRYAHLANGPVTAALERIGQVMHPAVTGAGETSFPDDSA